MNWRRKITRILLKTLLFSAIFIFGLLFFLYFAFQTEGFQTWAAQKATGYLSKELGTEVSIKRLKITFIKDVTLQGVFIGDKHGDTLLAGNSIRVNLSGFDYENQKLNLDEAELSDIKIKLLKYKGEDDFNFQFLADYFASSDTTPSNTKPWIVNYGTLILNNVDFTYRLLRDTNKVVHAMNYNNIHVSQIYGRFSEIEILKDTIRAQITGLRAREHSGVVLSNLTAKATVSPVILRCDSLTLQTPHSYVKGRFSFNYSEWNDYNDFINKIYIKGRLKDSTYLSMKDVAYFAEDIYGFKEVFYIKGKVRGYINDLSGTDMDVRYRDNTQFKGDLSITGLPDINSSYIHFDADRLSTSKADLEKFPLPPFTNPEYLKLPSQIANLGVISYKGKLDGFMNNFATYGTFKTAIGTLRTDLQVDNTAKDKIVRYSGNIATTNFNFSKLFTNSQMIGPISLKAKIVGKGLTLEEMDTRIDGKVEAITYNNYQYNNLKIDGEIKKKIFSGQLVSKDSSANFDFNGTIDFNHKVPKFDFISTINNFDLKATNFATSKLDGSFSSQIFINLNGDNIDNLTGQINFDNTQYKSATKTHKLSTFNLELDQDEPVKNIRLNSSILNAQLSGRYKLSSLADAFTQYLNAYFPTFVKTNTRYIFNDKADITIRVKNFGIIKELFIPDLMISPNTTIEGSFDAAISYLYLKTGSDLIEYSGVKFKNNGININSLPNGVKFDYTANVIQLSDSLSLKKPSLSLVANDRTTLFDIDWDNLSKPNYSADINGRIQFSTYSADVIFDKFQCVMADSVWRLIKANPVTIDTSYYVTVNSLTFYNQNQLITLDGILANQSTDKFNIFIQNFRLNQFNSLIGDFKTALDGTVTGNADIYAAFGKTIINSNINFNQFKINNRLIGNGEIKTSYDPEKEYIDVSGYSTFTNDAYGNVLKNIEFKGYYFPKKKEDNIDLTFKAEPFDVSLLQPFLKDIFTFKMGYVNGNGHVTGSLDNPIVNARFKIFKCVMVVDYTNVQYTVSGNINIQPTQIDFDGLEVRDKYGNSGSVDGHIFHKNFKNLRIDFDINTNKLMVLNTTAANNPSYYGTAYASGNAGLYGFFDDLKMEINMKTNGGTYFYIPVGGPSEIGSNDFIRFITKDTVKKVVNKSPSNFSLDFNLEATPDAEIQLIFDEKSGDVIKARGQGNLSLKINSKGKFDMFGEYVLSSGDYLFTLENFVTKKFEIQRGSSIKWNGNVYKADIDITAIYRQRASLRPIYPADSSGKRYTVECKLYMKNKLTQPDISFGIDLPTIDENTRSAIKSILLDENELNRQVFSLLLLRSFITPVSGAGSDGVTAGGAVANTGSEMLSNKLSNWLNGVTKEVDVGVNYRPGTGLSNDELDLTLNKQLFNSRLVIESNFGVSNNANRTTNNTNNSNLIGDVTLEYKLTESGKYRVKGFNRSNDNTQVINNGGPFTQGVGLFYREEFETLNELFRRYLNKLKGVKK